MTRDDIINMAREAGMEVHPYKGEIRICSAVLTGCDSTDEVIRFAALVAAAAVAAERESWRKGLEPVFRQRMGAESILVAVQHVIRARGAA